MSRITTVLSIARAEEASVINFWPFVRSSSYLQVRGCLDSRGSSLSLKPTEMFNNGHTNLLNQVWTRTD